MNPPSTSVRHEALKEFERLLQDTALESKWQSFFERCPFALTEPLAISPFVMYSQVQLRSGLPDFVFVQQAEGSPGLTLRVLGVIELKRPRDAIIRAYSKHLAPSAAVATATAQIKNYLKDLTDETDRPLEETQGVALSSSTPAYVIAGRWSRTERTCSQKLLASGYRHVFPQSIHVADYETLLDEFRRCCGAAPKSTYSESNLPDRSLHGWRTVDGQPNGQYWAGTYEGVGQARVDGKSLTCTYVSINVSRVRGGRMADRLTAEGQLTLDRPCWKIKCLDLKLPETDGYLTLDVNEVSPTGCIIRKQQICNSSWCPR